MSETVNPYRAVKLTADPGRTSLPAHAGAAPRPLEALAKEWAAALRLGDAGEISESQLALMIAAMNDLDPAQPVASDRALALPTLRDIQTFQRAIGRDEFHKGRPVARDSSRARGWTPFTEQSLDFGAGVDRAPPSRWGLSAAQKQRIKAFTYLNENEETRPRYEYIDNIGDGRGYTGGVIGYNIQSGSMLTIVEEYTAKKPGNELARYIPRLRELNQTTIHEVTGMDGFVEAWKRAANDPLFQLTQDENVDRTFNPAMLVAEKLGIKTAFGKLVIYDAMVQHGLGDDDPDGLVAIIRRTQARLQGDPSTGADERKWLEAFLTERRSILACAHDPETRQTWAPSVERVDFLREIFSSGNFDLKGPIDAGDFFDNVEIP